MPRSNPFDNLIYTMSTSARDWGGNKEDAWIWGIVVGWDGPSLNELQFKFGWTDAEIKRLTKLHSEFDTAHQRHSDNA